jgi:hypothetical protein
MTYPRSELAHKHDVLFSFVPWVGPADHSRLALPFEGRHVTVYVGIDRIGKIVPFEKEVFKAFDPANKYLGPFPSIETAALGLWRAFLFAAEETARIKAGHAPTPIFERKLPVYAGAARIGTVDVFSDGSAATRDGAGKPLGLFPSAELAVKICHAKHNGEAGISSNSLN